MEIRLSRHARRQMKWRGIDQGEIETAINNPDRLEDTKKEGRMLSKQPKADY